MDDASLARAAGLEALVTAAVLYAVGAGGLSRAAATVRGCCDSPRTSPSLSLDGSEGGRRASLLTFAAVDLAQSGAAVETDCSGGDEADADAAIPLSPGGGVAGEAADAVDFGGADGTDSELD